MKIAKKSIYTILGATLIALISGPVLADKVGAAMTGVESIGHIGNNNDGGVNACSSSTDACPEGHIANTGWGTILELDIQTQNHAELAFDMALQCGLITDTTVKSKGGKTDISEASGQVSVRIEVTYANGDVAYAMPGTAEEGVTYCSRVQSLAANFAGLNCTADITTEDGDPADGEVTCEDPEELRLVLSTLNANAFNYILTGVPVGTHHVKVQARATASFSLSDGTEGGLGSGDAQGEAFVGMGSLFVDEVQLINGYGFVGM